MDHFVLHSEYQPTGDQPQAIAELVKGFEEGNQFQTLLGVTGSGKTFTGPEPADADHFPQQDAGGAALRRDEGVLPGERGGVFCELL